MSDLGHLIIQPGDELTFDVLTWRHEGYEFGAPCLMLSPIICEDSDSNPASLIERACILACVDGKLRRNTEQQQIDWRGWNLKTLRRAFNQALAGKRFPVAGYQATRKKVRFVLDKNEGMTWLDL